MASSPELISFGSRGAMAARIADLVEAQIMRAIAENGRSEVGVSGGSTPKTLYENLAARALPWNDVRLTLIDERWVDVDHPRSNEAFIRGAFAKAKGATITGLYTGAQTLKDGVADIAATLDMRRKPFDTVILGMGDDGHTASWFPHAEGLNSALEINEKVCAVTAKQSEITGNEVDRMTLTLAAIKDAQLIILLLAGASKRATFELAMDPAPVEDMPVRAILRSRPDLWVCWAP